MWLLCVELDYDSLVTFAECVGFAVQVAVSFVLLWLLVIPCVELDYDSLVTSAECVGFAVQVAVSFVFLWLLLIPCVELDYDSLVILLSVLNLLYKLLLFLFSCCCFCIFLSDLIITDL